MTRKLDKEALHERLRTYRTALLTTMSKEGYLHTRPMMTQEREPDADLWFVSALDTEKIAEIQAHPRVGVIYYRDSDNAYVSLSGDAHVETDKDLIRSKWKESWKAWFPEGPEQANICMIKIDMHEAEYWEPAGGKLRVMFEMARAAISGDHPEINPPVEGRL